MDKLRVAVHKFTSCDGCQLQFLTLEDELLTLAERVDILHFNEATDDLNAGPFGQYDISFCEGSVSTPEEVEKIKGIRANSTVLIVIGACGQSGGLQGLRNWGDIAYYKQSTYEHPEYIDVLPHSTPFSDHVKVDAELPGCPPDQGQIKYTITSLLAGAAPRIPTEAICLECKRDGNVCVLVAQEKPCMGPITRTGCGALCPHQERDCYSCFGPQEGGNFDAMGRRFLGLGYTPEAYVHRLRFIYSWHPVYRDVSQRWETKSVDLTPLPSPPSEGLLP